MKIKANNIKEYLQNIPEERKEVFDKLMKTVRENIPKGFSEELSYGIPAWVVPHSLYPKGYHCSPELPLPFVSVASQKNFIALYHMGIYATPDLLNWFIKEYPKHSKRKLDMGKSCIRFKKMDDIPFELIGDLMKKMNPKEWMEKYESAFVRK
ncbi:MAG: DUF1801 domain-containing protein [Flavobacteriales bacterium]|nr:DUF1801 domain-containing protein [Flavobacteriales bacterium]MBT6699921.1 DUF1801 domain-containing protein [Flavobacteriales bacterium]MBT6815486.1 DUF1801 domain-containing protein [Flavobacteriales bacterium]MBT7727240.1 DUF1801 domain-containing protein [Flavobacteriales bacterium]